MKKWQSPSTVRPKFILYKFSFFSFVAFILWQTLFHSLTMVLSLMIIALSLGCDGLYIHDVPHFLLWNGGIIYHFLFAVLSIPATIFSDVIYRWIFPSVSYKKLLFYNHTFNMCPFWLTLFFASIAWSFFCSTWNPFGKILLLPHHI